MEHTAKFFNAEDFYAENMWVNKESHIQHIDPWLPPTTPWGGEEWQRQFWNQTKFALVDLIFDHSGNLEIGADIEEADHFDGHIRRLIPHEGSNIHKLILLVNKKPPKFISNVKLEPDQFDTLQPPSAVPETLNSQLGLCHHMLLARERKESIIIDGADQPGEESRKATVSEQAMFRIREVLVQYCSVVSGDKG